MKTKTAVNSSKYAQVICTDDNMTIVKREFGDNKYGNSENTHSWNLLPLSSNVLEFILKLEVHLFPDVKNDTCFL